MKDREVFERFMSWMGMKESTVTIIGNNTVVTYIEGNDCDERFTTQGYDDFVAGAVYDETNEIVIAYIDSHVAFSSENYDKISRILQNK